MIKTLEKLQTEGFISRVELTMAKKAIAADRKDLLSGFMDEVARRLETADMKLTQEELIEEAKELINN
ncbi:hypothetical protein SAMN05443144_109128 [Fodinibius roseus]|uniref:Uncharacterized protein n=1 Tax=Fodinibius roseus TaxID=1194090 RepID=A0A1M5C7Q0_9BACT|nr:hypothetical protein [Fodinibius roseus]SHF50680.1 hypothetical protein SAMN05443144_109128 [Fodinibius roseus]